MTSLCDLKSEFISEIMENKVFLEAMIKIEEQYISQLDETFSLGLESNLRFTQFKYWLLGDFIRKFVYNI